MTGAPLGNNTKFASFLGDAPLKRTERRLARWDLQRMAAKLLPENNRLAKCCWCPIGEGVEIVKSIEPLNAHYGRGIAHCGSVSLCPVCSAKITEVRRAEVAKGIANWKARGYTVLMVTFTLSHGSGDLLIELIDRLIRVIRRFKSGEGWQELKHEYNIEGSIKAFEFTWGLTNGWHPHIHMLFFIKADKIDPVKVKQDFGDRYVDMMSDEGGKADFEHGIDVKVADEAAGNYLAKMGIDYELTKGAQKSGREHGHYTPFELLELAKSDNEIGNLAKKKFKEFARSTKGVNFLRWSKGLRDELGLVQELTDQEIAEGANDKGGRSYYTIGNAAWCKVRVINGRDQRGIHLEIAKALDTESFALYLINLLTNPPGYPTSHQESLERVEVIPPYTFDP